MRISYEWLKTLCDHALTVQELSERLSGVGLCVDTYEPVGDDWALEVEVTSNRPDCLSMLGIAREVAAIVGTRVRTPEAALAEAAGQAGAPASVEVLDPDLCPHYTARVLDGVRVGPSPEWMQRRLTTCGMRPVSNVVDITNYVLLETGQPLHAFDLDRLEGAQIKVRRARPGEKMVSIDGTERTLTPEMCVIADARRPVAIGGIMGGLDSEIGAGTRRVLLESARFNPRNIRRTSRALNLRSDSSYRFERAVDPEGVVAASRRAAQLIVELAGGRPASGLLEVRNDAPRSEEVAMRFGRLEKVLGIKVPHERILQIFRALELKVLDVDNNEIRVRVPTFRHDLSREIDLIEEVARFHGYDKIAETTSMPVVPVTLSKRGRCEDVAREVMVGSGFYETVSSSLVDNAPLQRFTPWCDGEPIALANPASKDKTHLRRSLLGNLLIARKLNQDHGLGEASLFELSRIYLPRRDSKQPEEKMCLSALSDQAEAFFVLKGAVAEVCRRLGLEGRLAEEPCQLGLFQADASLRFTLDGRPAGVLGLLSAERVREIDLHRAPALVEMDFDVLSSAASFDRTYRRLPQFPAIVRDLALIVREATLWAELEAAIRAAAPALLESINFFDIYRGKQIPEGMKSVAFSLVFRSPDRTLRREEADEAVAGIVKALGERLGARLRA